MERVKAALKLTKEESQIVSNIVIHPHRPHIDSSFYNDFAIRGIRVDRVQPGLVVCSFRVPPRLTDKSGKLASGAIASLVDIMGVSVIRKEGIPMSISVNISILYVSNANVDDELELASKLVGKKGFISGTTISIKNKATGEAIAEGRVTFFSKPDSKI